MDMKSLRERCQSEEATLRVRCLAQRLLPAHFTLFGTLKRVLHQPPMTPSHVPPQSLSNQPLKCLFHMWHQKISCFSWAQKRTFTAFVLRSPQKRSPPPGEVLPTHHHEFKEEPIPSENAVANLNVQNSWPSPINTCKNVSSALE